MSDGKDKANGLLHHLVRNGMTYDSDLQDAGPFLRSYFHSAHEAEAVVHELYVSHMLVIDSGTANELFSSARPWESTNPIRMAAKQVAIDRVNADLTQAHMTKLQYVTIALTIIGIIIALATWS